MQGQWDLSLWAAAAVPSCERITHDNTHAAPSEILALALGQLRCGGGVVEGALSQERLDH
jgi:hypothetical protein